MDADYIQERRYFRRPRLRSRLMGPERPDDLQVPVFVTAVTYAPRALAIWTANVPTPPAPQTSTRCPARTCALSTQTLQCGASREAESRGLLGSGQGLHTVVTVGQERQTTNTDRRGQGVRSSPLVPALLAATTL